MIYFEYFRLAMIIAVNISLTLMVHKMLRPGQMFGFYGDFLDRKGTYIDKGEKGEVTKKYRWFWKPLGGCPFCMNFWQSIAVGLYLGMTPICLIGFVAISHVLIRVIQDRLLD